VQWKSVCEVFSECVHQSSCHLVPIHIFILSNVLRRPIIILSQTDTLTNDDHLSGVFLPVLHAPTVCCRSPLIVAHVAGQFVPLVPRSAPEHDRDGPCLYTEPGVPLWRADANEALTVRCLLGSSESAELALTTYLRVIELSHTSATNVNLFPVAKYDVITPDINIVDELQAPTALQSDPTLVCCALYRPI